MKRILLAITFLSFVSILPVQAADYKIDTEKAHASINFRIQHLGFSWLSGRFDQFSGQFSYDKNKPQASSISVDIDTSSIDSNYAERDKHLRSDKFLDSDKFPKAKFVSTSFEKQDDGSLKLIGNFTLHGVTRPLTIMVGKVSEGADPWGGYRVGFIGKTHFTIADYGIDVSMLGPSSRQIYLTLLIEGIRQ